MINLKLLSVGSGHKTIQCTVEEAWTEYKKAGSSRNALIQEGHVVKAKEKLKDNVDAVVLPHVAGG